MGWPKHLGCIALTFVLVTIGWVPFRAPDFETSLKVLGAMFGGSLTAEPVPVSFWVLLAALGAWTVLDRDRVIQSRLVRGAWRRACGSPAR